MFSKTPTDWLANWSEDGTDITVPLATFPELTAAEADAATGDIRKILFAISEALWQKWNAIGSAGQPTQMTIGRSSFINEQTGVLTKTYTLQFKTVTTGEEVADEPT